MAGYSRSEVLVTPCEAFQAALGMAGSQSGLARVCGCTQGAIWQMLQRPSPQLSTPYVLKVEAAYGIPRHLLRPDIYPAPNPETADTGADTAQAA